MPPDPAKIALLRRKLVAGLSAIGGDLVGLARTRQTRHVDVGTLRNSITHTEKGMTVLFGVSLRTAPHARYLERGFRPHWTPARYISLWARRTRVPLQGSARNPGLFVGGPGSTLDYATGGATARFRRGRRTIKLTYRTQGEESPYLARGKVGFSVIRHTVDNHLRDVAPRAFMRGYSRA